MVSSSVQGVVHYYYYSPPPLLILFKFNLRLLCRGRKVVVPRWYGCSNHYYYVLYDDYTGGTISDIRRMITQSVVIDTSRCISYVVSKLEISFRYDLMLLQCVYEDYIPRGTIIYTIVELLIVVVISWVVYVLFY